MHTFDHILDTMRKNAGAEGVNYLHTGKDFESIFPDIEKVFEEIFPERV